MPNDLRSFRHGVSVLKKQGLLPSKLSPRKKLDARKALPNWKIKGKRLDTLVRKYDDVVTGKASAVSVPPSTLKSLRKSGFETAQGKVLVPHSKQETARFTGGNIRIKNKNGIERVQIPIEFHNLRQYLEDLKKNTTLIDRMKRRDEYFGIRFFGGQRANFYRNIDALISDLERYEDFMRRSSKAKQAEIYRNLEIIKITSKAARRVEKEVHERRRSVSKADQRRYSKKRDAKMRTNPKRLADYRERKAAYAREWRASLTPAEKKQYKKKAKERQAKSYAKNHKAGKRRRTRS